MTVTQFFVQENATNEEIWPISLQQNLLMPKGNMQLELTYTGYIISSLNSILVIMADAAGCNCILGVV